MSKLSHVIIAGLGSLATLAATPTEATISSSKPPVPFDVAKAKSCLRALSTKGQSHIEAPAYAKGITLKVTRVTQDGLRCEKVVLNTSPNNLDELTKEALGNLPSYTVRPSRLFLEGWWEIKMAQREQTRSNSDFTHVIRQRDLINFKDPADYPHFHSLTLDGKGKITEHLLARIKGRKTNPTADVPVTSPLSPNAQALITALPKLRAACSF